MCRYYADPVSAEYPSHAREIQPVPLALIEVAAKWAKFLIIICLD